MIGLGTYAAVTMRISQKVYLYHSHMRHECSAQFSAVLELCNHTVVEMHLSLKVYLHRHVIFK